MLKNIIYLDEEKMYSLSSQVFEGITEYVINEDLEHESKGETQKGPVGSGRVLGDILKTTNRSLQKKFLHDYSYICFEEKVLEDGLVFDVGNVEVTLSSVAEGVSEKSFIKVKGKATFNDVQKITEILEKYNDLGEAITHMGLNHEIEEINKKMDGLAENVDRNQQAKLKRVIKEKSDPKKIAKENGLYKDPRFLRDLSRLIVYGYANLFEVQQKIGEVLFSSTLKRDCIKENEELLIKKFSRKTDREFVVFGIVAQTFAKNMPEIDGGEEAENLKAAIMNIVEHLTNLELNISGKQNNEIVIDPIAVYFDI